MGETAPDLFYEPPDRLLDFGDPIRFELDRGITDKHWLAPSDTDGEPGGSAEDDVDAELGDLEDREGLLLFNGAVIEEANP